MSAFPIKVRLTSVARLSVALVSPGRTENRDLREKEVSARPERDTHGGSAARVGVAWFGS